MKLKYIPFIIVICMILTGCKAPVISTHTIVETNTVEIVQPTTITVTQPAITLPPVTVTPPVQTTTLINVETIPTTVTVTVTQGPVIGTTSTTPSSTWLWTNKSWCFASLGATGSADFLYSYKISNIGGGMPYVYSRLPLFWSYILQSNVIILYNSSSEPLSDLSQWPTQYISIFPFSIQQLESNPVPFVLAEPNGNNSMSIIVVANSDIEIEEIITMMMNTPIPVGVIWTISN
jgi:hypothetical protein